MLKRAFLMDVKSRVWSQLRSKRNKTGITHCSQPSSPNGRTFSNDPPKNITTNHTDQNGSSDDQEESTKLVSVSKDSPESNVTWESLIPLRVRVLWSESLSAQFLKESMNLLRKNLWTLMSLTALNSGARFLLVWTLYKTVCGLAVALFGVPAASIPQEMIPTSGSVGDPEVYQQLADITFLLFKPFDFVLRGIFVVAGLLVCQQSLQSKSPNQQSTKRFGFIRSIWNGFLTSLTSFWKSLKKSKDYVFVYVTVGGLTVVYQALALLIVPFLFALRRLVNIQLSICTNLFEGKKGREALEASRVLVEPIRRNLYFPYLFLLLSPKLLGVLRDLVVKGFPDRLFAEVPEITWGLIACTTVTAFLIDRMADIFPVVVFSSSALNSCRTNQDTEDS